MKKAILNLNLSLFALLMLASCNKDNVVACVQADKTNVQINEEITFTNCTKEGEKYMWQFGDGTTSEEVSPKHTFKTAGVYKVILSVVKPKADFVNQVYVLITVNNGNNKFLNLKNGTYTRQFFNTKNSIKGAVLTDTGTYSSLNTKAFMENPDKIAVDFNIFINKGFETISNIYTISANKFEIPKVDSMWHSANPSAPLTFNGATFKYEGNKVIVDWSFDEKNFKATANDYDTWIYHAEFLK